MGILSTICNIIIITGSVLVAIKTITDWCGKPIQFFKKKTEDNFDARVEAVIKKTLPKLLEEHDKDLEEVRATARQQELAQLKGEVLGSLSKDLEAISTLSSQYLPLVISARDVLREKIMGIYHKNKYDHTLSAFEKEALEQYYKDYKAIGGNSYIDKYYNRMSIWKVDPDDYTGERIL